MSTTEQLWRDFLVFCAGKAPDDWLALDFVQFSTAELPEPLRRKRAESDLQVLQVLLTWRARRAPRSERPDALRLTQTSLPLRLRRTG